MSRVVTVLGLDTSTASTGYAHVKGPLDSPDDCEVLEAGTVTTPAKLQGGQRLTAIRYEIYKLIQRFKPDYIAIENLRVMKFAQALRALAGLLGVAMELAWKSLKQEPFLINPQTAEKKARQITGLKQPARSASKSQDPGKWKPGTAPRKFAIVAAANQLFGLELDWKSQDDVGDAVMVGFMGYLELVREAHKETDDEGEEGRGGDAEVRPKRGRKRKRGRRG